MAAVISSQGNYIGVPQMTVSSQAFSTQPGSGGTYVSVPMTTVIQHRMATQQGVGAHQRLGPSPACAVSTATNFATNFYIQTAAASMSHPHSHTPGPIPTPTPTPALTPTPTPAQQVAASTTVPGTVSGQAGTTTGAASSCSLAKLQQLTNGLEMIPSTACGTMTPPPSMNLTPPPPIPTPHHPHATMTPPPSAAHQMLQQQATRTLSTPPSSIPTNLPAQMTLANYHKYYQTNMNVNNLGTAVTPPVSGSTSGRSSRSGSGGSVAAVQQMQAAAAAASSRVSPNVTINPNLISQYGTLNGYRMAAQQTPATVTGYITNTAAAGFINQATQIPVQMGVMNMAQTQYQDPAAIQRAAQQNTMYTTYGYINGSLMQPMRR